ncbi:hypothetical protein [Candidatus Sororendozoicomonas aggregata]|uniref:hypothetical protein n=1 Tax=Candidatus Sororendozoicomonas aggregata TaxID=3073239 RepID=UPI002ED32B4D
MNILAKVLVGASIGLLTTVSFAAGTGNEVSTSKISGGWLGSGIRLGKGYWSIAESVDDYDDDGDIRTDIMIYDIAAQKTAYTNTTSEASLHLYKDVNTYKWYGTFFEIRCKNLGGMFDGCHLGLSTHLSDIKVELNPDNVGMIAFKRYINVLGKTSVVNATYKLSK